MPPTQPTYWTAVEPNSSQRSKVPSPREASAHEASTTAWPWSARRSGPPGSDGPSAAPMARKREFIIAAATSAAPTVPPAATMAIAVNCAEPAKTIADMTIAAVADSPAPSARTPNDSATTPAAMPNGAPARSPSTSRARRDTSPSVSLPAAIPSACHGRGAAATTICADGHHTG